MSISATGSAAAARWATRRASAPSKASAPTAGSVSPETALRIDLGRLAQIDGRLAQVRAGFVAVGWQRDLDLGGVDVGGAALVVHDHLREDDGQHDHDE